MPKTHRYFGNIDLTGQKFDRLLVIKKVKHSRSKWLCQCDCGNTKEIYAHRLINGLVHSCGCLEKENIERISKKHTHGMAKTILYSKWCGMKERCYNPNSEHYDRYGGRGITICDEWLGEHGFENFLKWAYEVGYDDRKKGWEQSIDRIDVNKGYSPDNCRWTDRLHQSRNRENNVYIKDIDDTMVTASEFNQKHNIDNLAFTFRRIKKNISAEDILKEWEIIKNANDGKYYTKEQAAEFYNVSKYTILSWVRKGLLEGIRTQNYLYILKGQPRPQFTNRNLDGTFNKYK